MSTAIKSWWDFTRIKDENGTVTFEKLLVLGFNDDADGEIRSMTSDVVQWVKLQDFVDAYYDDLEESWLYIA